MQTGSFRSNRERLEDAKIRMNELDQEIKNHELEIERLKNERALIMKEMSTYLDDGAEERLLSAVYEQRKKIKGG